MKRLLLPILLLALFIPFNAFSQSGSAGLSFLKNGVGARSVGMGDVGVVGGDMGTAMYYNPALLADDSEGSITIMHNEWIQDISTDYLGISLPAKGWTFGLFLGITSVAEIEVRDGPSPTPLGTTDSKNFAGGVTVAFSLAEMIDIGANAKFLFEKIHTEDASGYAFDIGASIHPFDDSSLEDLKFGVALANLGSMSELNLQTTVLPSMLRYGAGYVIPVQSLKSHLNIEANGVTLLEEETTHLGVGLEFDYVNMLYLRFGYQTGYDTKNISFGVGAAYSTLRFDYAFVPFSDNFGTAHTVALSIAL